MSERVTASQLQAWTNKSYRTIARRISEAGIKPVEISGKLNLYDSAEALPVLYIAPDAEELDLTRERAKVASEQARKYQRENDVEEGKVAPMGVLTDALQSVTAQMVPLLEALPLEMKRGNPNLTANDIMKAKKCIAKCRNAIADIKIDG